MHRTVCAVLFLVLLACNLAGAASKYAIKELGVLPGDVESSTEGINNKGQIVGTSWTTDATGNYLLAKRRSFLWEGGRLSEITAPVGKNGVVRMDINDSGLITIAGWDDSFVYEKGKPSKIEPLPGCKTVRTLELNNRGDVLANGGKKDGVFQLFVRRNGVVQVIEPPAGLVHLLFTAMNQKGQVALNFERPKGPACTALWENGKTRILEGVPEPFHVCALSDDGTIVGQCDEEDGLKGCVWRNGAIKYLQLPQDLTSAWPESINKDGLIAGTCMTDEGAKYAVVWDRDGVATELPILDAFESEAVDINDAGTIVGKVYGEDGRSKAVMWTPVK